MWKSGEVMPELAVGDICRSMKIWLVVKILPFSAYVVIFIIGLIKGLLFSLSTTVLCALFVCYLLWRNLKRIGRIKRREFAWCEGVTAGISGRGHKGDTLVDVEFDTLRCFGHPAGVFYIRRGRPVYVVKLNILESSVFRGGFIADPLIFKIKDNY